MERKPPARLRLHPLLLAPDFLGIGTPRSASSSALASAFRWMITLPIDPGSNIALASCVVWTRVLPCARLIRLLRPSGTVGAGSNTWVGPINIEGA